VFRDIFTADVSGRAVYGVGLRPLAFWDCGFETFRFQGALSLVSVVCCQAEVCATVRSLVQYSLTECVFVCVCLCLCLSICRTELSRARITLYTYNE